MKPKQFNQILKEIKTINLTLSVDMDIDRGILNKKEYDIYTLNNYCFRVDLNALLELSQDSGDYWNPPTCEIISHEVDILEIKEIYNPDADEILEQFTLNQVIEVMQALEKQIELETA